jgi:hypothetical protein
MPDFQLLPQFFEPGAILRRLTPFHQDVDFGVGVKAAEGEIRATDKQRYAVRRREQIHLGMEQRPVILEHPQIGLQLLKELDAVRMGLIESRPDGRRNLSLEALKVVERQAVPLLGIAAPGHRDVELAVFPAAALEFPREACQGTENDRL